MTLLPLLEPQPLEDPRKLHRDRLPQHLIIGADIVVCDEVARGADPGPIHIGVCLAETRRQAIGGGRQIEYDGLGDAALVVVIGIEKASTAARDHTSGGNAESTDVIEYRLGARRIVAGHTGTASERIRSSTAPWPRSETTSTGLPRSSSASIMNPARSNNEVVSPGCTSRSISESSSASPRATDPKTRTSSSPRLAAAARSSSRVARTRESAGTRSARSSRCAVSKVGSRRPTSYADTLGWGTPARAASSRCVSPAATRRARRVAPYGAAGVMAPV